jgi:hypothetical protein
MTPAPTTIIVPRTHGELLIEPPLAAQLHALTAAAPPTFTDPSLATLRQIARDQFLIAATAWANQIGAKPPPSTPNARFLLTGHQLEFYHPGVWAKVIAADELAKRAAAQGTPTIAFDLLVDHDTVDHRGFDIPAQADNHWSRIPVDYAPPSPLPADALTAPSRESFDAWDEKIAKHPLAQSDALAFFMSALRPIPRRSGQSLTHAQWLSRARTRFETSMGITVHHIPTSLLCSTESFLLFVNLWIDNADRVTRAYNHHLTLYRQRQQIKNPQRPMPDLARTESGRGATTYELPFWIYRPNTPRQRLTIRHESDRRLLLLDNTEIDITKGLAPALLAGYQLRPRALTLTMFTRLFLADLFIHGIGGALYDQITDALLQDLFGTVPPYSAVSAAWLLPLGKEITTTDDLAALKSRRHHIQHNPQLAIDPFTALKTDVAELITARRTTVEAITTSLATSRKNPTARQQRRALFDQLHNLNAELHTKAPRLLANLDAQLENATRALTQNKVLLHREWFFPLHTTSSLHHFITSIRQSQ